MSHETYRNRTILDATAGLALVGVIGLTGATAPMWAVGLLVLGLIPLTILITVGALLWQSRRRDTNRSTVRAGGHGTHPAPPALNPSAAHTWDWPARTTASPVSAGRSHTSTDRPAPFLPTSNPQRA